MKEMPPGAAAGKLTFGALQVKQCKSSKAHQARRAKEPIHKMVGRLNRR
jgi:hypothetical protein